MAEIQGEYGPICISELLIQKLWLRQELESGSMRTTEGAPVRILSPGRWNRLEGPDFLSAEIEIAGQRCNGDVEIHFYCRDWQAHGHDRDSLYGNVILHAVVFPPLPDEPEVQTLRRRKIPSLVLLPYLKKDLESCALDEALDGEDTADPLNIAARLLELEMDERLKLVRAKARERWMRKVRHASAQLEEVGWSQMLHEGCLEALGFRRNRAPMRAIAREFQLKDIAGNIDINRLFETYRSDWKLNGLRPANHPLRRLQQYSAIAKAQPDWPGTLLNLPLIEREFDGKSPTTTARQKLQISKLSRWIGTQLFCDQIGGTRLHTITTDLLLPSMAAHLNRKGDLKTAELLYGYWYHWQVGDVPDRVTHILKVSCVAEARHRPACNGLAQGGLQLCLEGVPNLLQTPAMDC